MTDIVLYNSLGIGYNHTRKADLYIAGRLFSFLNPLPGKLYLDIGCGTGNYTTWLSEKGLDMIGLDPSEVMLSEAKSKNNSANWIRGVVEDIRLANNSVDGAIATLTMHHWADLQTGFSEIARVLKPGSLFVIFSFTPEQEKGYWINHFFPEMMARSQLKAIPLETVLNAAEKAGLNLDQTEKYFVQEDLQDMFCYSAKHNPEIYFDPAIRSGISSFANLANKHEVDEGLKKLRKCIDSGEFEAIKEQYNNDNGDYLFIVLKNTKDSK